MWGVRRCCRQGTWQGTENVLLQARGLPLA